MENSSFLSLKMKNSDIVCIDEEHKEGSKDTVYMRHMGMQNSFSNKVSVLPQFRPYKIIQDDKSKRVLVDPISSQSNPIPTTDAWDANRKAFNAQWVNRAPEIPKPVGATNQLTIFYAGAVRVFDNVSPEKARTIMHMAQTVAGVNVSVPPSPGLSSPISVTSQPTPQSGSGSTGNEEKIAAKPVVPVPTSHTEPPKTPTTRIPTEMMSFSAVPQARNASLKRFLEKRKERLTSTTPYNTEKKTPESSSSTPISEGTNLSTITGLSSVSASKEQTWFSTVRKSEKVDTTLGL